MTLGTAATNCSIRANEGEEGCRTKLWKNWFNWLIILLIGTMTVGLTGAEKQWIENEPKIGKIYDCQDLTHTKIHALPSIEACKEGGQGKMAETFQAEVRQYRKQIAKVELYYCEAQRIDKVCKE